MDHGILFRQFPVKAGVSILIPPSVKPNGSYRTIISQQFRQLIVHELIIAFPVSLRIRTSCTTSCTSPRIIFPRPVKMRVVEMEFDSLFAASCCQLLDDIPLKGSCLHDIEVRILGIEHGEAVMMAGSQTDIFSSRCFDGSHPLIRIKLGGIETACQFGILFIIQIIICHSPLTGGKHGIQSPMKENTEFIILKFFTGFEVFFTRLVRRLCVEPGGDSQTHTY